MGRAKEIMIENEEKRRMDEEYQSFSKELLVREEITDPLKGIAKQLTGKGYASLSEVQKRIVEKFIEGYKQKHICDRCQNGNVSSLQDYLYVADNGYCPMCEYDKQQFMKD